MGRYWSMRRAGNSVPLPANPISDVGFTLLVEGAQFGIAWNQAAPRDATPVMVRAYLVVDGVPTLAAEQEFASWDDEVAIAVGSPAEGQGYRPSVQEEGWPEVFGSDQVATS